MTTVVCIGEALAELSFIGEGSLRVALGGDVANVAVRLRRARPDFAVRLSTAIGDDPFSGSVADRLRDEGVELVGPISAGQRIGIYLVQTDPEGERRFTYWREGSAAARHLGDGRVALGSGHIDGVHVSGITLALLGELGRDRLREELTELRAAGTYVLLDPNHRLALWADDRTARQALEGFLTCVDAVTPSLDDMRSLFGTGEAEQAATVLQDLGVPEAVLTEGDRGCHVVLHGSVERRPALPVPRVVDTTGAGDAFDAGWLAARLDGRVPGHAADAGLAAAAASLGHPGALPPQGISASLS